MVVVQVDSDVRPWSRPVPTAAAVSAATLVLAARRVGRVIAYAGVPALATAVYLWQQERLGAMFFDFEGTIWRPLQAFLAGGSPYPAPQPAAVDIGNPAVYPPVGFLVGLPLVALPFTAAAIVWTLLLGLAAAASLWLLGVRDWRCYTLALGSFAVLHGVVFGNITILLVVAAAVAWRYRDRPAVAGLAVGTAIALKLFLWPLAVWLLVSRRWRAAGAGALAAAALLLGGWAVIGFSGLREYPDLLRVLTDVFAAHSTSLYAVGIGAGLGPTAAQAVAFAAAALVLVVALTVSRRWGRDDLAFALCVAAALLASPIVWPHYFALTALVLAVLYPAYGHVWLVLPATWVVAFFVPVSFDEDGPCCGPLNTPEAIWRPLHGDPQTWRAVGYLALLAIPLALAGRRLYRNGSRRSTPLGAC